MRFYMTVAIFSFQADRLFRSKQPKIKQLGLIFQIWSPVCSLGFGYWRTDSCFVLTGCYSGDLPLAAEGPCHSERSGRTAGKVFRKLQPSRRRRTIGEQAVSVDTRVEGSLSNEH